MSAIRRMIMGSVKKQAVTQGTITLTRSQQYIDIQHNLDSDNYILCVRNTNPILRAAHSNGAVLVGRKIPTDYNNLTSDYTYIITYIIEGRTNMDYYGGQMGSLSSVESYFTRTSARCYNRNNGYNYPASIYEWVAINLDAVADAEGDVTISSDTYSKTITDNLGTSNKIALMMAKNPVYGAQDVLVNFGLGNFFNAITNTTSGFCIGLESRTGKTYSQLSDSYRCGINSNTITIMTRANTYVYKAGEYEYKVYKI